MKDLDRMYKGRFFRQRKSLEWRIPHICRPINDIFLPKSVVDLGCGNGDIVKGFCDMGIFAVGVEGTNNALEYSLAPEGRMLIFDLRESIAFKQRFDLCLCFEVAEHLPDFCADTLIHNITTASDTVLFTAAPPGQGGLYHVNCQPQSYWITRFCAKNYEPDYSIRETLQKVWGDAGLAHKKGIKAYYQNLLCFRRKVQK